MDSGADLSDYMNNDILHVVKGLFGDKFKKRSSVLSGYQIKIIVVSEVTKEVFANPDKYTTFADVLSLASEKVLEYSSSLRGIALDKLVDAVKSRLAVIDNQKAVGKQESEFND